MKRLVSFIIFFMVYYLPYAQHPLSMSDTIIMGPDEYRSEVIRLYKKYNSITDSISKSQVYLNRKTISIDKTQENFYLVKELSEYEKLIKQFLPLARVNAVYYFLFPDKEKSYYEISFKGNNTNLKSGKIRWYTN